jgi:hypothetical protein
MFTKTINIPWYNYNFHPYIKKAVGVWRQALGKQGINYILTK